MSDGGRELDLRAYARAVRRRWKVVAVCAATLVAVVFLLSMAQQDQYEGVARVLVQPRAGEAVFDIETGPALDPELALRTEIDIIESAPVRQVVREQLGPVPEVEAERVAETLVIEIKARNSDPVAAARVTNAFATAYIDLRRQQSVDDLLEAGAVIEQKVAETQQEITRVEQQLAASAGPQQATHQARLQGLIGRLGAFEQRLDEVEVEAALKTGGVQLAGEAVVPEEPVAPRPLRNSVLAAVLGLVLGLALAALLEYLDESVKSRAELEEAAGGLAVLASVPVVPAWGYGGFDVRALAGPAAIAPVAEAYRSLRTSVELLGADPRPLVVQITSANSGEGKTTTIAGLAVMLANLGRRVVVVDGDLRRARLHEVFRVSNQFGLASILAGEPVRPPLAARDVEGLWVVPSGPTPSNPSELLADLYMPAFLHELKGRFDIVLLDSPPVLPVTDATVMAAWADATVLVATHRKTTVRQIRAAVDRLRQADAPLVGTVLNGADDPDEGGYSYGYDDEGAPADDGRRVWSPASSSSEVAGAPPGVPSTPAAPPLVESPGDQRA